LTGTEAMYQPGKIGKESRSQKFDVRRAALSRSFGSLRLGFCSGRHAVFR
jgi:hypothetical protein